MEREERSNFINQIASIISRQPLPPTTATGPDFVQHLEQRDVLPKELLNEARKLEAGEIDARIVAHVQAAAKSRNGNPTSDRNVFIANTTGFDPAYLISPDQIVANAWAGPVQQ